MARGGGSSLLLLGGLGLVGWYWANAQPAGSSARKTVDGIRASVTHAAATIGQPAAHPSIPGAVTGAGGLSTPAAIATYTAANIGTAPGGSIPHGVYTTEGGIVTPAPTPIAAGQYQIPLALWDTGGVQLWLDPNIDAIVQDPTNGGTNIYGPGDVVLDQDGNALYIMAGRGGIILQAADGSYPAVDAYRVDVIAAGGF